MRSSVSKGHHSSRLVLAMMIIIILLKKSLIFMLTFSKDPSTMKEAIGKEIMTKKNLILLTRTTRMSLEELFHQEGLSQPNIKISSLDTIFLAIILVIKQ
jgi:hypothetical protein